jgi:hypothetical protein
LRVFYDKTPKVSLARVYVKSHLNSFMLTKDSNF